MRFILSKDSPKLYLFQMTKLDRIVVCWEFEGERRITML
jgi:hypothetical protein